MLFDKIPMTWHLVIIYNNSLAHLTGCKYQHTHTRAHLTALFRDYPGELLPKGKTNLDFTEARDSEWQWHQLGHMQVCTSLQTDNHASTPPLS